MKEPDFKPLRPAGKTILAKAAVLTGESEVMMCVRTTGMDISEEALMERGMMRAAAGGMKKINQTGFKIVLYDLTEGKVL